ncbi:MAG: ATP-dependent RecD-like DNA helicase [Deltaproteobacteria bacterium]|nr:ATP-dependent RecD-like DNA helicase [Deltaproteobacteria bacterium]
MPSYRNNPIKPEEPRPVSTLQGQIERITYTNEENGYTVAKLKVYGQRDLVTIVGNLMAPTPGEILSLRGEWTRHAKFGEQFKIISYKTKVPATVNGIQKYLGSGLIKGIGPEMAKRIVKRFGKTTLTIIEETPDNLQSVDGIGPKRVAMIKTAWADQKEIREVMLFLQSHGVSAAYAAKIFKQYGNESIPVVTQNPYRLATDIFGIGFVTADRIAENLGFGKESELRAQAGILYVLHQLSDDGHVYYPYEPLIEKCREILDVAPEIIVGALGVIFKEKRIVIEDLNDSMETFQENHKAVYLAKYHLCETSIARRIDALRKTPKAIRSIDADKAIAWVQERLAIRLAEKQAAAIRSALTSKVMVITGGPGTGKTTIIHAILKVFARLGVTSLLAAPTGRAAKRMSEATGREAKTIHRLLAYSLQKGGFQKNEKSPLDCDLLIVDEASMVDTVLMHHLMKAIPPSATLILVGDVHQLPSVGAGNVLKDIIASHTVEVVTLNEIFRQASQSQIIVNAHRINSGKMPVSNAPGPNSDFFMLYEEDPETALQVILDLARNRIPKWGRFDPFSDIQVLTPMHRGVVGASNLNNALQEALNPRQESLVRGNRTFRVSDKVMQIRNNYDKEVYNGDIGRITRIDPDMQTLTVSFENRPVAYDFAELDELVLAYAVSVHKAQGSEYPVVIMPVLIQHYMLLQRNLIYTAVTRGRQLVVLVGTKKALAISVRNNKTEKRHTRLTHRLAFQ